MRQILYMAHPVAPTEAEIEYARMSNPQFAAWGVTVESVAVRQNCDRAMQWLSWLRKSFPETTFIAPWISSIMAGEDDSDPKQREAGLVDCCAVVERCDGIVLVGGRISSGMRREMEHGKAHSHMVIEYDDAQMFEVYDLTKEMESVAPLNSMAGPRNRSFVQWYAEAILCEDGSPFGEEIP